MAHIVKSIFIDIKAGDIVNKAEISAGVYIKFVSSGDFTNGISGADNANIKIAATGDVTINANNDINVYKDWMYVNTNMNIKMSKTRTW